MVKGKSIVINGNELLFEAGETILDVARRNDIDTRPRSLALPRRGGPGLGRNHTIPPQRTQQLQTGTQRHHQQRRKDSSRHDHKFSS